MSTSSPKISIVTPVYNGAQYIEFLIQSVLEQAYPYIEHIVIDDGSDDDGETAKVLRRFPHLEYWGRNNHGQYATMNEGLEAATGDWVCFVSADDLVSSNAVSTIVEAISKHPEADGFFGRTWYINEDGSKYAVQPAFPGKVSLYRYLAQIPHCSVYMRRDYLLEHNYRFDASLRYNGDYDWFLSVLADEPTLFYVSEYLSLIRKHDAQISRMNYQSILDERTTVFRRHQINMTKYRCWNFLMTLRHASLRIFYQFQNNGFQAGTRLIWYFIKHKIGLV